MSIRCSTSIEPSVTWRDVTQHQTALTMNCKPWLRPSDRHTCGSLILVHFCLGHVVSDSISTAASVHIWSTSCHSCSFSYSSLQYYITDHWCCHTADYHYCTERINEWSHRVLSSVPSLSQLMCSGWCPLAAHSSTRRLPSVVVTSRGRMMNCSSESELPPTATHTPSIHIHYLYTLALSVLLTYIYTYIGTLDKLK